MNMSCARVLSQPARSATHKLLYRRASSLGCAHLKLTRSIVKGSAAAEAVYDWLGQFHSAQGTSGDSYFTRIIQQTDVVRSFSSSSVDSISSTASQLSNSTCDAPSSNQCLAETALTITIGNHTSTAVQASAGVELCQQQVQLPSSFSVPSHTTVPAYQLVGVFRSMLGWPNLPQAAKTTSVEAKWGMLQLTLRQAEGDQQGFAQQLQQLLDGLLLPDALRKLRKVQGNPKIPELNKQSAEQRYQDLYASCRDTITSWAAATVCTPAFRQLQPAMVEVSKAMKTSLASGSWHCSASSASSGKLMEQTAVAVLQASLPPNWSLLPSLHLLGADGQVLAGQQGCKHEVDMLVLDEQGTAVAIVEVKLAAANPLMSLFNDVNALLRLVDQIKGKMITAITESDLSSIPVAAALQSEPVTMPAAAVPVDAAASAANAAHAEGSDGDSSMTSSRSNRGSGRGIAAVSLLAKARAATRQAPFAKRPSWQPVHVKLHPSVVPIYILGKSIGEAEVLKGLASLVDSAALKLLSTSAADVAEAIMQPAQVAQQQQQRRDLPEQLLQAADNSGGGSLLQSNCDRIGSSSSRIVLSLSGDQQQRIFEQVQKRMAVLQQCMIYSICTRKT